MENFKKHKWSRKYDCCVICWSTKKKHKGRWIWLCCWDKERLKNQKRAFTKKLAQTKYWMKMKILSKLTLPKKKKSIFWDKKEQRIKDRQRFWYYKNRWEKWKNEGKNVLQIIKNWEKIYLPILAEEFEKPKLSTLHLKDKKEILLKTKKYEKDLKKYKKYLEIFEFCRNFKTWEEIKKYKKF